jgi:hypothetical protein
MGIRHHAEPARRASSAGCSRLSAAVDADPRGDTSRDAALFFSKKAGGTVGAPTPPGDGVRGAVAARSSFAFRTNRRDRVRTSGSVMLGALLLPRKSIVSTRRAFPASSPPGVFAALDRESFLAALHTLHPHGRYPVRAARCGGRKVAIAPTKVRPGGPYGD